MPNISCSSFSVRVLVQALGDHHGVALHIDDDGAIFGQPVACRLVGPKRRFRPLACFAIFRDIVYMQVSFA